MDFLLLGSLGALGFRALPDCPIAQSVHDKVDI